MEGNFEATLSIEDHGSWPWATGVPVPNSHPLGARVRIAGGGGSRTSAALKGIAAVVVEVPPPGEDGSYVVELYAPTLICGGPACQDEFLVPQQVGSLSSAQLLPCADCEDEGLTVVNRPGSTMCLVPVIELHLRGLGENAEGCTARLGGLASRQDLHGLPCTITRGPDEKDLYTVGHQSSVFFVRPECLTLWSRRDALWELVRPPRSALKGRLGNIRGEFLEPHPSLPSPPPPFDRVECGSLPTNADAAGALGRRTATTPENLSRGSRVSKTGRNQKFDLLDIDIAEHVAADMREDAPCSRFVATPGLGVLSPLRQKTHNNSSRPSAELIEDLGHPEQVTIVGSAATDASKKGHTAFKSKRYGEAIEHFTEAIRLDSTDPTFYSSRSACYVSLEQYTEAQKDGAQCILLKPDWPHGYLRKALADEFLGQYDEAITTYKAGLKVAPNHKGLRLAMHTMRVTHLRQREVEDNPSDYYWR